MTATVPRFSQILFATAALLLVSLTAIAQDGTADAKQEIAQGPAKIDLVIYQVRGAAGEKLELPKELEPFKKKLQRTLLQKFTIIGDASNVSMKDGEKLLLTMPKGLGQIEVKYEAKSKRIRVDFKKGDKKLGSVSSSKYPLVTVNNKLKLGKDQFILIIDEKKSK